MIYDQPIHNFPGPIWFEEIAREDFNDPDPVAVQPPRVLAGSGAGRPQQPADVRPDHEPKVINPYSID